MATRAIDKHVWGAGTGVDKLTLQCPGLLLRLGALDGVDSGLLWRQQYYSLSVSLVSTTENFIERNDISGLDWMGILIKYTQREGNKCREWFTLNMMSSVLRFTILNTLSSVNS